MPKLPPSLEEIYAGGNLLAKLPAPPPGLRRANIDDNRFPRRPRRWQAFIDNGRRPDNSPPNITPRSFNLNAKPLVINQPDPPALERVDLCRSGSPAAGERRPRFVMPDNLAYRENG
ncbi:hypothetical protein GRH90_12855 [Enterobacteriales bacterium SAP-6]|uniref:Uncharacterized protein n=1 Tax=Acerihabitans arboris TaxID=2691583 RepID=A0A845SF52_9GAMM|nr:hypothetical protein [Acerihabitans arboris]